MVMDKGDFSVKRIFTLLILILASTNAQAQTTTGNIEGTVTGPDGEPLGGAIIEARGPGLQGTSVVPSQENGYFLIPDLPVGSYDLQVTHDHYAEVIVFGLVVRLGATTPAGIIEMAMEAYVLETMVVTAASLNNK